MVVQTKNAAETLESCLKSVSFADELIVVDMQSSDATRDIAKEFTENVDITDDVGYVEPARNFALEKATGDWILLVDADEVISKSLQEKITSIVNSETDVACYFLPRKNIIFGKWVKDAGWWPDMQPRLFRAGALKWEDKIHSQPSIKGITDEFSKEESLAIIHSNYKTVSDFIDRLNRYTSITSEFDDGNELPNTSKLVSNYRSELLNRMFKKGGIDGGYRSTLLSLLQANYELVVAAKRWEKEGCPEDSAPAIEEFKKFNSELAYWIADWHVKRGSSLGKVFWKIRRKLRF